MEYSIVGHKSVESIKDVIESTSTSAISPDDVLEALTKFGIEWYVTAEGTLMIKYWQIIADGFVSPERAAIIRTSAQSPDQSNELDWLSKNLQSICQDYAGQWIAISENRIIGSATDLPSLMTQIVQIDKPFITFIPSDQIVWTFTYAK